MSSASSTCTAARVPLPESRPYTPDSNATSVCTAARVPLPESLDGDSTRSYDSRTGSHITLSTTKGSQEPIQSSTQDIRDTVFDTTGLPDLLAESPREAPVISDKTESGWAAVAKTIREIDEQKIQDYKEDIDTILVFVRLHTNSSILEFDAI